MTTRKAPPPLWRGGAFVIDAAAQRSDYVPQAVCVQHVTQAACGLIVRGMSHEFIPSEATESGYDECDWCGLLVDPAVTSWVTAGCRFDPCEGAGNHGAPCVLVAAEGGQVLCSYCDRVCGSEGDADDVARRGWGMTRSRGWPTTTTRLRSCSTDREDHPQECPRTILRFLYPFRGNEP